ncbi:AraC family transcriptional regulator [Tahibacter amnicola]|uniref:AraC family transcriptional regulator n=1 Tax=Tahibacter amnicola TaxID=2976241 RepID=A0ABY6BNN8_9GAMM|nr:AraC family transcriptional regulator [Tahibacter amnicola]UXI69417.1 AraC family transcriptional regulator [Tahibacter amnicola]
MTFTPDVSQLYADAFREFTRLRGLGPAPGSAMSASGFVQRVGGEEFCNLVESAVLQSGDPDLGFRFGAAIGGRGFGLLGIATAAAPTLAHSLNSLARWESLTCTLGAIDVVRERASVRVRWLPRVPVPPALIEGVLAGWVAFGRFLVGESVPVSALELTRQRRSGISEVESLLGCTVRYGAPENAVVVPAAILDAQPRYADAQLHASLANWLDDCVRVVVGQRDATSVQASEVILHGLAWGDADEDGVARRLGLARRTLQRRLAADGLSFRRLRDLLRASIAVCRLSGGRDRLIDVAQHIGFAEQATFCRAVRQWTGRSPREVSRLFSTEYADLRG